MTERDTLIFRTASEIAQRGERHGRNLQAQELARILGGAFRWLSVRRALQIRRS